MNATERAALSGGVQLYEEMASAVGERTLEILDRRRRTSIVKRRGWLVRRLLLASDLLGLLLALFLAEWLMTGPGSGGAVDARGEIIALVATLPLWVVAAKLYRLYDHDEERANHSTADDFAGVFHMVTVCTWLFALGCYVTGLAHPTTAKLAVFWLAAVAFVSTARATARALARRNVRYLQNSIVVGAGEVGQLVAKKLLQHPEYGINLLGFVDAEPKERSDDLGHLALLGGIDRLAAIVRVFDVERVIIAFSNDSHEETLALIRELKDLDVQIDIVPRLFELVGPGVEFHTIEGLPLIGLPPPRLSRSSRLLKRTVDLIAATLALVLLGPLLVALATLIRLDSPGPVFFRQTRMGQGDRAFRIIKFRTMAPDADQHKSELAHLNKHLAPGGDPRMFKIVGDPRITRSGRWLRRYSLDELPQLINVVRGQMSLVGPRPLILDEDKWVSAWARQRLNLKPGITGPWQVLGRSEIPFEEMLRLDYLYVSSWSIWNDLRLIARTLPVLMTPRGG